VLLCAPHRGWSTSCIVCIYSSSSGTVNGGRST
jgi:hypothetical protein